MNHSLRNIGLLLVSILSASSTAMSQGHSIPGEPRSYSTIYSLGLEWDMEGDDDHDATCALSFRAQGEATWRQALDLFRVDYTPPDPVNGLSGEFSGFAGSVLFVEPDTIYDVRLELSDPDGGSEVRETVVTTFAVPEKPVDPVVYHVIPGSGGGTGASADPFLGIEFAQSQAAPGSVFNLHAGTYQGFDSGGEIQLNSPGTSDDFIVWQAAGDGAVVFGDPLRIAADFIWVEGIHIRGHVGVESEYGLRTYDTPEFVVITRNLFTDFYYSIALNHGGENWVITDNTIIGDKDVIGTPDGPPSYGGEGIELEHTSGHTVAYNSISRVADGV
ncbi:MAG: hypothetical protein K8R59_14970, partial [Thermoanaerobaculales bacterium]|nr:hypothetical protein [Thermoanaerobaculales bacterium]